MCRLNLQEDITLLVGPSKEKFTAPKCFLTKSAEFFKACCSSSWKEGQTNTIELPEETPETFSAYLQWLYTEHLVIVDGFNLDDIKVYSEDEPENSAAQEETDAAFKALCDFAVLADRLGDASFTNTVIDWMLKIVTRLNRIVQAEHAIRTYAILPKFSGIRRLLLDLDLGRGHSEYMERDAEMYTLEYTFDLAVSLMKVAEKGNEYPDPRWESRCNYHEHRDGASRCT